MPMDCTLSYIQLVWMTNKFDFSNPEANLMIIFYGVSFFFIVYFILRLIQILLEEKEKLTEAIKEY
jgi:hypothetical protein